jgi:hypothetical protein
MLPSFNVTPILWNQQELIQHVQTYTLTPPPVPKPYVNHMCVSHNPTRKNALIVFSKQDKESSDLRVQAVEPRNIWTTYLI